MGLLNDFKRLFFAKKSVAKSAGQKAVEKTKEFVDDVKEDAQHKLQDIKHSSEELANSFKEKASETIENVDLDAAIEKAKKFTDKIKGAVTGEEDIPENMNHPNKDQAPDSEKPSDLGHDNNKADTVRKTPEWLENAGEKAVKAGEVASEKFQDLAEKVGKKALDLSDELSQKSRELADKLDKKLDEIDHKARKMAEQKAEMETPGDHAATRHDENPNLTRSTLEETDSFFEKAKRFADGESITPDIKSPDDQGKKASGKKAYGFEDLDGDGNEIVDDAIIDDEED